MDSDCKGGRIAMQFDTAPFDIIPTDSESELCNS